MNASDHESAASSFDDLITQVKPIKSARRRIKIRRLAAWIARHEIWPLILGAAAATLTPHWASLGLALLTSLWLVRWIGAGSPTVRTPFDWPALILLLMVPVTFYATFDPRGTAIQISRLLAGLCLAYGIINWARSKNHLTLLVYGFSAVGLGLAFIAPFSVIWPITNKLPIIPAAVYQHLPIASGDIVNPNMMAGALVILLPFPLAAFIARPAHKLPSVYGPLPKFLARILDTSWFRRLFFGLVTIAMLAVLVMTKSRGGLIAAAVVVFLVLVYRWKSLFWLLPLISIAFAVLVWKGQLPVITEIINPGQETTSWDTRLEEWSRALYMIQDFPFTGVGAGNYQPVANLLYPFFLLPPDADINHAHNLILQVAVDLGLPGLIAYLAILLLAIWSGIDALRPAPAQACHCEERSDEEISPGTAKGPVPELVEGPVPELVEGELVEGIAWAGIASIAGMLVHGLVDATTWIVGRGALFPWAVIGLLVALGELAPPARSAAIQKSPEKGA